MLAALYRFHAWPSALGNDCFILANDEGQAADDLSLAKKLIAANDILAREVEVKRRSPALMARERCASCPRATWPVRMAKPTALSVLMRFTATAHTIFSRRLLLTPHVATR
jgi:hypothetical protein